MKTTIKTITEKILFELTIVVLGILLAIGINYQYQVYQQKVQASKFLSKIEYEITANLKSLERVNSAFDTNIRLSLNYISQLKSGENFEINYSLDILAIDFGVWNYAQNREELDQLPVDLLISISESYRALEKAELNTIELTLSKIPRILANANESESDAFNEVLNELNYAKFYLDLAQIKLSKSITLIENYRPQSE